MSTTQGAPRSHDEAFELIPWLVNGRLPREEQDSLERHLAECVECRREADAQRQVRNAIRQDESNVEYAPHASFQKLWSRIEESQQDEVSGKGIDRGADRNGWPTASDRKRSPPQRWMLAAGMFLALGLGLVLALRWPAESPDRASEYRTATTPPAQPDREGEIRAVFAPNVTIDELTRIVSEARLTIVSGPSDSGVYTLAVQPGRGMPAADALAQLRSDPRVRFAEPVVAPSRGDR
jgi:hypothetical protein